MPGTPYDEASRRRQWLQLPRMSRAAIRRMHTHFGHCRNEVLREILKGAKADPKLIEGCKFLRCEDCSRTQKVPKQTNKVSLPKPFEFNHTIGIGICYLTDDSGMIWQFLNIVCSGTDYQVVIPVRSGKGQPTSRE